MAENSSDWRGNSNRFPEGKYLIDPVASLLKARYKFCEMPTQNGSVECRFLTSALSRWHLFIPGLVEERLRERAGSMDSLKTGVDLGMAIGVMLTAGCQECGRHSRLSTTLSKELIEALSWKSLVLSPPEGTFILWRLEIGNRYRPGRWETF